MNTRPPQGECGMYLDVKGITKSYRDNTVLDKLDFSVLKGELVSLLGPSGCGKTTLLRMVAGLVSADSGTIRLAEREVTTLPAHRRNVSVVFQNYALFPHLNVRENVGFGLSARGMTKAQQKVPVEEALALVRMEQYADRPISALSGGQQQRVAVARALVVAPDLLLLDEPFSALDRKLRETMQVELKALLRSRGITAVFVTHDQEEALAVSDRIAVMNAGRIEQYGGPMDLYSKPATSFVLDFVGMSMRLAGTVKSAEGRLLRISTAYGDITAPGNFIAGARVLVGVRPELISPGLPQGSPEATNRVTATLSDVMCLGAKTLIYGAASGDDCLVCEESGAYAIGLPSAGSPVTFGWRVEDTLVYPAEHRQ
ncbi:ABC transporter ATP-binding protein [Rhizobium sp. DBTS2]|uniref:ABC transporter ATP-binding protein n=2 Tax=Mycoplana rhizolycopersici TaxID=2746702 RepID=A0ABX2QLF6_9HYPH|nr:ABC transporter ATP-binding protein [Rhizobium rhizolycopersici]